MYAELPYVAFVAAFLVLIPLPWHWRSGNVATLAMVAWLFVINVIYGVDAIIWSHNVKITALVWCDISASAYPVLVGTVTDLQHLSRQDYHRGTDGPSSCLYVHQHPPRSGRLRGTCPELRCGQT